MTNTRQIVPELIHMHQLCMNPSFAEFQGLYFMIFYAIASRNSYLHNTSVKGCINNILLYGPTFF